MLQLVSLRQKQSGETPILVYNNIYVGNYWFASQEQYLRGHAIGLVVSCMEKPNIKQFSGIQYKEIPIRGI